MTVKIRPATPADMPAMAVVDGRAFGYHMTPESIQDAERLIEPERFLLACADDGTILGLTGSFLFDVTLPGGAQVPAPGVTWVGVDTTHRRRGILRALMTEQHHGFLAQSATVSLLTASESSIYGRFGYGEATRTRQVRIDRRFADFRDDVPDPGGVRYAETDDMRIHAPEVHRRWRARTPGAISRSEAWWTNNWLDREYQRHGASRFFHLTHPDGYASYRIRWAHGEQTMDADVFAATDEAHIALWRVLLTKDLVTSVSAALPLDDPLPFLLTDPRRVTSTEVRDGMWARVLDVPAVLSGRRYATEVDVVIGVHDAFLDRGGRFRLRGGPDAAICEFVSMSPDVELDVADLGSLLFGTYRASTLARAGRLTATDPAALRRVDAAFPADRDPVHGTEF